MAFSRDGLSPAAAEAAFVSLKLDALNICFERKLSASTGSVGKDWNADGDFGEGTDCLFRKQFRDHNLHSGKSLNVE